MTTVNYEYLRGHGPSTMAEMPRDKVSVRDKQAGIWKFGGNWSTGAQATGGVTVPVFYIRGTHFERQVVRAWMHANPKAIENLSHQSLVSVLYRNGSEFVEPVRELVGRAKNAGPAD